MSVTPIRTQSRIATQTRQPAATHLFAVGQAVRFRSGFGRPPATPEVFYVTRTLPPQGGTLQYRIRNDAERHERVTSQNDLEAIRETAADTSLMERTFGHG